MANIEDQPSEEIIIKCEVIEISDEEESHETKKKRRKRVTSKEPQPCDICGKVFQTGYELKKHKRTHTGERPYMCTTCGKTYTQLGHLSIHSLSHKAFSRSMVTSRLVRVLTAPKDRYVYLPSFGYGDCPHCDFSNRETALKHRGIKNFNCNECGSSFYRKADLDRHEKIHTGEKPFQCELCPKSFTQKNNLVMHFKMHIGDKPHKCDVCNKRFLTRSKMVLHSKKHDKEKKKKNDFLGHI